MYNVDFVPGIGGEGEEKNIVTAYQASMKPYVTTSHNKDR